MNKQVNNAIDNLVTSLRSEGTLKTPKKFTLSELHSRIEVAFTNPLTNDCLVDSKILNEITSQITDKFRELGRIKRDGSSEDYSEPMTHLKWFLNPSNPNGFGSLFYIKSKKLQDVLGLDDEKFEKASQYFHKVVMRDGNHKHLMYDLNNIYREYTFNGGKITKGLGDDKQDVKVGDLKKVD